MFQASHQVIRLILVLLEKFMKIGINDVFGQSGKPADLLKEYELTGPQIAEKILKNL